MEVIIKYPKGKFYTLSFKKYVNLAYIGERLDSGIILCVEDFVTKRDITSTVALKAIAVHREGLIKNGDYKIKKDS